MDSKNLKKRPYPDRVDEETIDIQKRKRKCSVPGCCFEGKILSLRQEKLYRFSFSKI